MIWKWKTRAQSLRSLQGKQNPQGREGKTLFPLGLSTGKDIVYLGNLKLKGDNAPTVLSTETPGIFFSFSFCYQTLRTVPVLDFPILEESSVQLDSISSGTNGSFRLQSPGWAADRSGITSKQNQKPTWCDLLGPALVSLVPMLKVLPLNSYQGVASEWFYSVFPLCAC